MDSDVFVDFLLDNGLYKTAQELIIELEAAGEPVPAKLIGFFGRADSNSVKSGESGIKEDAGHRLSSEQLALYDVLSQIAPGKCWESKDLRILEEFFNPLMRK